MKKQIQNTSYQEMSKLIISAIEDEQFFRKDVLIPKVKAIMTGFQFNLNARLFNQIEKPSEAQRRMIKLQEREAENLFWKNVVRKIDVENIQKHYDDCEEYLKSLGFRSKQNRIVGVQESDTTEAK